MTTWACIATGPSLRFDDLEYVRERGWKIATCNNAVNYCPDTSLHHAHDYRWWRAYYELARQTGATLTTTNRTAAREFKLRHFRFQRGGRWQDAPDAVAAGGPLSGLQLIQLAVKLGGASRVILLGYDMQHTGGMAHCHGDHPAGWRNADDLGDKLRHFKDLAMTSPVPIINCTRETAIDCFPRMQVDMVD